MMIKKLAAAVIAASTLFSLQAFADDTSTQTQSPWLIRLRAIDVVPDASSSTITGLGGHVNKVSNDAVPELDISYFLTKNIATELILGTTKHDIKATGTALGQVDLGSVRLLPPTLTLQYHFLPNSTFDPYVGAGVNYTYFYGVNKGPVASSINYSNSFGPALQAGADIAINKNWLINFDVKKLFIQTNATVNVGSASYTTTAKLNPVVYGMGVGYRFS
ncbi:MAG: outer membrane protein OmpW [Gammaproteobacteria bacterium]|jgi:outer membrane protein|nr:outer membrane protein OmpW [Gammaproteobacteria bacterium]